MSNSNILSKTAQTVQDVLNQKGLTSKVLELPDSTRTAQDAATTIGCEIAEIIKSLIFRTKDTNKPILVLASGINRVNEQKIYTIIDGDLLKYDQLWAAAGTPNSVFSLKSKDLQNLTEGNIITIY